MINLFYVDVSLILHSCMCTFMTLAPMDLEASCRACRSSCDDEENGSAPRDRAVHSAIEIVISHLVSGVYFKMYMSASETNLVKSLIRFWDFTLVEKLENRVP